MRIVVTGEKGVGKSTLVRRIMTECGWLEPHGFITRRVEGHPGEPSLLVARWHGDPVIVARWTGGESPADPKTHELDTEALCDFARKFLMDVPSPAAIVLDELGILELDVPLFTNAVAALFHRQGPLLAVIQERALGRWLTLIGPEHVDRIARLDGTNEDMVFRDLVTALK